MYNFSIPEEKSEEIANWMNETYEKSVKITGKENPYGASGGAITYEFTPTNLGMVIKIKMASFKLDEEGKIKLTTETLDVTDYDMW